MTYELAQSLWEAGFRIPVHTRGHWIFKGDHVTYERHSNEAWGDACAYVPSLSELIEACITPLSPAMGELFHLIGLENYWVARRGSYKTNGSTPIEAVAKLWISMNAA